MLKCLILEDEQDAQSLLNTYIQKVPTLQILGMYESGLDVPFDLLRNTDLLFLDIHLPGLNGIDYLKSLDDPPRVIITSAYPDFALKAFDLAVADYLLKPFSFERFYKSIRRITKDHETPPQRPKIFYVYADKTTYKIKASDILYIKAEVDYVKIKTEKQEVLVLGSLRNWAEKLRLLPFAQTHRSYIINMEKAESISGNRIFLQNREGLPIGVTFKERVFRIFSS